MTTLHDSKQQLFPELANPDTRIWRYLDFAKYMAMLEKSGLFFARCDRLEDTFEGSRPQADRIATRAALIAEGISSNSVDELIQKLSDFGKWLRQWVLVNCWHISECESEAMWKLYAPSDRAIAMVSTYRRLRECLGEQFWIEQVQYIDYDTHSIPGGNALYPYLYKRRSFAHEQELRAFTWEIPIKDDQIDSAARASDGGIWHPVDLNKLIDTIRVAPKSPEWYRDLISDINKRYGLLVPTKQSDLDQDPIF